MTWLMFFIAKTLEDGVSKFNWTMGWKKTTPIRLALFWRLTVKLGENDGDINKRSQTCEDTQVLIS